MPYIARCFVKRPEGVAPGLNFDRRLYIVRREFEQSVTDTYIASLSCRICPAFCQRACVLGGQGEPVQIKANELFIIEFAFEKGFMLPQPPQSRSGKTAAIIGGGPAGMAAAWHLNRRGHLVTVYDQGTEPGGQLLQIPNNQLPPEIVRRRVRLMEEEGVVFKCGVTANAEELSAQYDTVVCCTGPKSKKESLVVLAIAQGKAKAAQADMDLMGFTSIEI